MKYNYNIMICKNNEWTELPVECHDVKALAHSINAEFGFQIVSRDSIYNYFLRPGVSNKRLFGKVIKIERTRVVPKRQRMREEKQAKLSVQATLSAKTEAEGSPETACQ